MRGRTFDQPSTEYDQDQGTLGRSGTHMAGAGWIRALGPLATSAQGHQLPGLAGGGVSQDTQSDTATARIVMDVDNPSGSPAGTVSALPRHRRRRVAVRHTVSGGFRGSPELAVRGCEVNALFGCLTACATLTRSCQWSRDPFHRWTYPRDARAGAAQPAARLDGQWRASWRAQPCGPLWPVRSGAQRWPVRSGAPR